MYNQKDVADWILQSKPVLTTIDPTVYHCSGLELTDTHTGETTIVDLSKLSDLIPLVLSDNVKYSQTHITNMAETLHKLHNPSVPKQPTLFKVFNHAQANQARTAETTSRGPVAQHKKHIFLTPREVSDIEDYFYKTAKPNIPYLIEMYNTSAAVLSNILNAKHRHSTPTYIETIRKVSV